MSNDPGGVIPGPSSSRIDLTLQFCVIPTTTAQLSGASPKTARLEHIRAVPEEPAAPVALPQCNYSHVLDFMRYLDQFGKTKVHIQGCVFLASLSPAVPAPARSGRAWAASTRSWAVSRSLRGERGTPETNPFANGAIRVYLREVRDAQAKARGIPYKKKKKRRRPNSEQGMTSSSSFHQMQ
ncbi:hypothetical protein DH2020_031551 [Rehmannia glutinosa]|uniref:ALOG domain-containing protein n=1 Tax=Rehmannia glutinosa TaxID=99300 RepID=A0ABR0VJC2_REHGL